MWDLIVSVPDHCLSFYFKLLLLPTRTSTLRTENETTETHSITNTKGKERQLNTSYFNCIDCSILCKCMYNTFKNCVS